MPVRPHRKPIALAVVAILAAVASTQACAIGISPPAEAKTQNGGAAEVQSTPTEAQGRAVAKAIGDFFHSPAGAAERQAANRKEADASR